MHVDNMGQPYPPHIQTMLQSLPRGAIRSTHVLGVWTHLGGALPGLGAGLHLALANGLVGVGRLVIHVLDARDGLTL